MNFIGPFQTTKYQGIQDRVKKNEKNWGLKRALQKSLNFCHISHQWFCYL